MKLEGFTRRATEDHSGPLRWSGSHDEAPLPFARAKIGQQRRFVHPLDGFNGPDLNDQFVRGHDVRLKASLQQGVAVYDRNGQLALEGEPGFGEFEGEAFLINRLEKPRPPPRSSVVLGGSPCEILRLRYES